MRLAGLYFQTPHHELIFLLLRGAALQRWKDETNPRDYQNEKDKMQIQESVTPEESSKISVPDPTELTVTSELTPSQE